MRAVLLKVEEGGEEARVVVEVKRLIEKEETLVDAAHGGVSASRVSAATASWRRTS